LRAPLSSFVGREPELALLTGQLTRDRLVTLTGPGGVGKTRLATTVAAGADFPGGAWLVPLAPVTDPGQVIRAWTAALGLREDELPRAGGAAQDLAGRLAEALSAAETLVVLDNCEHLIGAVAPLVEDLLGRCPRLRVMATSREPLGLPGEMLCPVTPLAVPEPGAAAADAVTSPAVRLFGDRATAAMPGFAVTDANAAAVAGICRRLDGLPLAIELAAARVRALPVEELAARLADRLGDRFAVLAGGSRTAPPRHRTLRAVVSWSWELLSDDERGLAGRLSVFGADITPDSAAAVRPGAASTARPAIDLLAALVDKSLLQLVPGPEPRYRMLETIREYGLARLAEAGELAGARAAHAAYFLELAETAEPHLRGREQLPWLAKLTAEQDNLLAALHTACDTGDADTAVRLAAALGPFWTINGRHGEAATSLRLALEVPGDAPAQARAAATALWAFNATFSGTPGRAGHAAALARALARPDDGHPATEPSAYPMGSLAAAAFALAADDAAGLAQIDRQLTPPEPWTRGMLRLIRGFLTGNHGDLDGMRRDLAAAAEAFRVSGERWGLATVLTYLAYIMTTLGRFDDAVAALEESVRLLRELGSPDGAVMQRVWLAEAFWKKGDAARARAELLAIMAPGAGPQPGRYAFHARTSLGDMARFDGDLEEAARQYAAAARDLAGLPDGTVWVGGFDAMLRSAMAHLAVARGDLAAAGRYAGDALALAVSADDMPLLAVAGVAAAGLRLAQGEGGEAARVLGAAHALRGGPDAFHPDVAALTADLTRKLGESGYQSAYDQGRRLDRAAALALMQAQAATRLSRLPRSF
jgi:predicted ATPase